MKSKQEIRKEIAARRRALDPAWTAKASAAIVRRIEGMKLFQDAHCVALYMAIGGEADLSALLPACWERDIKTCIPVFNTADRLYDMAVITPDTVFREGHYGIWEPVDAAAGDMGTADLALVPGVAFDRSGRRVGRGGGYYDRLLADLKGRAVAAAFDFQLLDRVPAETHDLPVDGIVTELQIINASNDD